MAALSQAPRRIWQETRWAQILTIVLGVVPAYFLPIYFNLKDGNTGLNPTAVLYYTIVWGGAMSLLMVLILRLVNGERIKDLNLREGKWWKDILLGVALMVATLGSFMLIRNYINGLFPPPQGPGTDLLFEELINNPRFFWIMTGPGLLIGAGIFEELTRILLLSRLWKINQNTIWRWAAVLFSAVIFGLMHMYQGTAGMILTGFSGLIMAVFYLKFGRILPMIIAHYLHDAVQFIVVLLVFN
jgi:membrane protease YdiL (CAAX protease family)